MSWFTELNEKTEERYIPFICCPNCKKDTVMATKCWEVTNKAKGFENFELTVYYCPFCDVVLNFSEEQEKPAIKWITKKEAAELGYQFVSEGEDTGE